MLDGKLTPGPHGGSMVSFERRIDRPIEKVWAALTIPERVCDWMARAEIELKVGGRYDLHFHGMDDRMTGLITRLEPPRLLELSWRETGPQSMLLWRLEPDGDGCLLSLTHTFPADQKDAVGFLAGWHDFLDGVDFGCDGVERPWGWGLERWRELDRQYRASLTAGIPSDAEPPKT